MSYLIAGPKSGGEKAPLAGDASYFCSFFPVRHKQLSRTFYSQRIG